jgi:hypothetical protein
MKVRPLLHRNERPTCKIGLWSIKVAPYIPAGFQSLFLLMMVQPFFWFVHQRLGEGADVSVPQAAGISVIGLGMKSPVIVANPLRLATQRMRPRWLGRSEYFTQRENRSKTGRLLSFEEQIVAEKQ